MSKNTKTVKGAHTVRNRIIAVVIILAAVSFFIFLRLQTRIKFYTDPATTGNTSTNLLNGGLFALSDGKIYFANPYDQNTLYSMNLDLGKVKKVYQDNVSYLNVAGDYIFYTRRNDKKGAAGNAILSLSSTGLYRLKTNGSSIGMLYKNPTQTATLFGNEVYYQHYDDVEGLQLFRVGINGKEDTMLLDEGASPTAIVNDTIYYTGIDSEHNIHAMNLDGSGARVICEGNFTGLSYCNGALYCLDMDNNYSLCRLELDGSNLNHLVHDRVSTYNLNEDGDTIYYQLDNGTDNGLYTLDVASGTEALLRTGNFNYFHVISNYLFFEEYDGSEAYVMNISTEEIQNFNPGVK